MDLRDIAERFLARPAKMLVLEPILLCMAFYISVVFGESWHIVRVDSGFGVS